MNYALVLAGGVGTRMKNVGLPKQFLTIYDKPIIIYTMEALLKDKKIDRYVIVCNKDYLSYLENLLFEYNIDQKDISICAGGKTRVDSTINGIKFIEKKFGIYENDIFIAHDSVCPFITPEIIDEGIEKARKCNAATVVLPATTNIVKTKNDGIIESVYDRGNWYIGKCPQIFNIIDFLDTYNKFEDKKSIASDLTSFYSKTNKTIDTVICDETNIKITNNIDLVVARKIIEDKGLIPQKKGEE